MHFIDEINFVASLGRRVTNVVTQLTHVFDAVVARAINLDHVETVAGSNLATVVAHAAWRDSRAVDAVKRFRQYPRSRCFADSARPDEQIRMRQPVLRDGILERARDMRLPDQIVKSLRSIFSRENFVAHAFNLGGKVDGW